MLDADGCRRFTLIIRHALLDAYSATPLSYYACFRAAYAFSLFCCRCCLMICRRYAFDATPAAAACYDAILRHSATIRRYYATLRDACRIFSRRQLFRSMLRALLLFIDIFADAACRHAFITLIRYAACCCFYARYAALCLRFIAYYAAAFATPLF